MAGLLILEPLGPRKEQRFLSQLASAGARAVTGRPYPRMPLLTGEEIVAGKRLATPPVAGKGGKQAQGALWQQSP